MTTTDDFLATIIAYPSNDAPRLVYADWLEERGETGRASFIRHQIVRGGSLGLGHGTTGPFFSLEVGYEDGLSWLSRTYRRGFVAAIYCSLADFLSHGPAIARVQPIEADGVRLDRQPQRIDGNRGGLGVGWWATILAELESGGARHLHWIPSAWVDFLTGQKREMLEGDEWSIAYQDEETALIDLHAAALLWARSVAPVEVAER